MRFQNQPVEIVGDDPSSPTVTIRLADGSEMSVPRAEVTEDDPHAASTVLPDPAPTEAPGRPQKPRPDEIA